MGALAKLRKGLDPAQRRQLIMIQSGAVWESSVLTKFIHQREPECKLCGCGQGVHHMLWECPHTAATGRPCALAAAAAHCAPPMLMERLIPCHPVGPGDRPGWGGDPGVAQQAALDIHEARHRVLECEAGEPFQPGTHSALIWTGRAMGPSLIPDAWDFPVGVGAAPAEPNVATDGSAQQVASGAAGYAAAAVHWPGRDEPWTAAEEEVRECRSRCAGGWFARFAILGRVFDSTRAELAALLRALLAPLPVHALVDSTSAIRAFRRVCAKLLGARTAPWASCPNGDVLAIIESAMRARGVTSAKVQWIKAHLSEKDALLHCIPLEAWRANQRVDEEAKLGLAEHELQTRT